MIKSHAELTEGFWYFLDTTQDSSEVEIVKLSQFDLGPEQHCLHVEWVGHVSSGEVADYPITCFLGPVPMIDPDTVGVTQDTKSYRVMWVTMAFEGRTENEFLVIPWSAPEPENTDGLFIVHHLLSDAKTLVKSIYSRRFMVGFRDFEIESEHLPFSPEWQRVLTDYLNNRLSVK